MLQIIDFKKLKLNNTAEFLDSVPIEDRPSMISSLLEKFIAKLKKEDSKENFDLFNLLVEYSVNYPIGNLIRYIPEKNKSFKNFCDLIVFNQKYLTSFFNKSGNLTNKQMGLFLHLLNKDQEYDVDFSVLSTFVKKAYIKSYGPDKRDPREDLLMTLGYGAKTDRLSKHMLNVFPNLIRNPKVLLSALHHPNVYKHIGDKMDQAFLNKAIKSMISIYDYDGLIYFAKKTKEYPKFKQHKGDALAYVIKNMLFYENMIDHNGAYTNGKAAIDAPVLIQTLLKYGKFDLEESMANFMGRKPRLNKMIRDHVTLCLQSLKPLKDKDEPELKVKKSRSKLKVK